MLYREIMAVCSEIHTKPINTLCGQNVELLNDKLAVHIVTTGLQRVKPTQCTTTLPPLNLKPLYLQSAPYIWVICQPQYELSFANSLFNSLSEHFAHTFHCSAIPATNTLSGGKDRPTTNTAARAGRIKHSHPNVYNKDLNPLCTSKYGTAVTAPTGTELTAIQQTAAKISRVAFHRGRKIVVNADSN
jgi:hypothetical protein